MSTTSSRHGSRWAASGETEFAARLFSLLCGAALCGLMAAATARRFGMEGGLIAALLLAAIPDFARYAARGQLDAPVALFLAAYLAVALIKPEWFS